jgi:hypothetical protein
MNRQEAKTHAFGRWALLASTLVLATTTWAACPSDEEVDRFVAAYRAGAIAQAFDTHLTLQEGLRSQAEPIRRLPGDPEVSVSFR